MIKELFSNTNLFPPSHSSSSSPTTTISTTKPLPENPNINCPRCDSTNTKFCYYNNYNLTQPRHFCKTCRRYWTKGGALRNVPIGGGCRKSKNTGVGKAKVKDIGVRSGFIPGFDHDPAQTSHLLSLLRSTHLNPNPNAMMSRVDPVVLNAQASNNLVNIWRHSQNQQQNSTVSSEVQSTGIQELYQRLKLSTNYYSDNNSPFVLSNVPMSGSSYSSGILESAMVTGGDLGYLNPAFSWTDLPATNGAYP